MDKPGWNFWPVVILGLLWNLMGCMNYVSQSNPDVVATMPESYQLLIDGRPAWATGAFAISVFGGAVGCILMLLRRAVSVPVLAISLLGTAVVLIHAVMVSGLTSQVVTTTGMSVVVAIILLWTAQSARGRGWLG
ncbi:MAG: hypothetical protein AAFQ64_14435 [Pseudomonadota bacterium]